MTRFFSRPNTLKRIPNSIYSSQRRNYFREEVWIDLIHQRIVDLEAENAELKAENAEIPELRKKFVEVEAKNAKLETENFEVKAEIMKLRAELKSGIEELEKSRTDTVAENARRDIESVKLKARVAKLEQDSRQPQNDSPFEEAFNQKITYLEEGCFGGTESEQNDELISPLEKNLIVEQELIQQLSTTINNDEVSSIFRRNTGLVDLVPSLVSADKKVDHVTKINKIRGNEDHVTSRIESTESSSQAYIPPGLKAISDEKVNTLDTSQARRKFRLLWITDETSCPLCKLDHNDEESIEVRRGIHVEENSVAFLRNNPNGIFDQSDLV
ncbi:hypothetical protein RclHR1_04100001 [Rhizophagus clarus]|uniref:Uncharacterized protein n=1 Tax=Rhizophagus clarus TaxID=94130 RepID=A0A2Z6RSK9_9GLOM|nr:hypothetical protein RclHR1_04100001 [Rhizophagus clarus]